MSIKFLTINLLTAGTLLLAAGCITTDTAYTRVAPGIWRGVLELDKYQVPVNKKDTVFILYDQFNEGDLPFNFEVKYVDNERFIIEIHNGTERIRCDSVGFGHDRHTARDTLTIWFPEYQSYLHAEVRGGVMEGEWVVTTKDNYRIPFYAKSGQEHRFTRLAEPPVADLTGEWATLFGVDTKETERAIGEFRQNANHLEGTFRTETGDYRFLEGTVQGRKFWLSCFDGAHAYLFTGSIQGDTLQGEYRSGTHYRALWTAWRDPNFQLVAADSLTTLKAGDASISFRLPSTEGDTLTFPSPAFEGKIKVFTIMGTWCPNCLDEQRFMAEFLQKNPDAARQLAVVGFAFERGKDSTRALAHLREYQKRLNLPFVLVLAGKASAAEAGRVFPALNKVMAFPTMIVLDKHNRVRRIHTGFDGPATSKYADFQRDFAALINTLLRE